MYKFSKYNLISRNYKEQYYIYNVLNKNCDLISEQVYEFFLNGDIKEILKNMLLAEKMIERGYIISEEIDEIEYIEYKYNKIAWDSEILDLTFIMTYACNFKCIYCYQQEKYGGFSPETIISIKKFIEKRTKKRFNKVYINWFGGEPLLEEKAIIELSDFVVKLGRVNQFTYLGRITTNGYLLTEKLFRRLLDSHIFFYLITIDGIKKYHDKQRPLQNGEGTYDIIMQNLRNIKKINRTFSIDVRINVSQDNFCYISEFLEVWNLEFESDRRFHIVIEPVHDWRGERIKYHKEQVVSNIKLISHIYEMASKQGTRLQEHLQYKSEVQFCAASKKNGFVITSDARIHKCEMAISDEKYKNDNCIGYIDINGEIHIDEQKEARWLTRKQNLEKCYDCIAYPFCMGGAKCNFAMKFHNQMECLETVEYLKWMSSLLSKDLTEIMGSS